jgi:hypothetical protein
LVGAPAGIGIREVRGAAAGRLPVLLAGQPQGRPPEWMLVKNEGHGFYDSEHRKEFYLRLEGFLARHIGPK